MSNGQVRRVKIKNAVAVQNEGFDTLESKRIVTSEVISDLGSVTLDDVIDVQVIRVTSDGGVVDFAAQPFGSSDTWADGIEIELEGESDTNYPVLKSGSSNYSAFINGDFALKRGHKISLRWNATTKLFTEGYRNV